MSQPTYTGSSAPRTEGGNASTTASSAAFAQFIDTVPKRLNTLQSAIQALQTRMTTMSTTFVQAISDLTGHYTNELARLERELRTLNLGLAHQVQQLQSNAALIIGNAGNVSLGSTDGQVTTLLGRVVTSSTLDLHDKLEMLDENGEVTFSVSRTGLLNATSAVFEQPLPVESGGTGMSQSLVNNRLLVSSEGRVTETNALMNGQLLIGQTGAAPSVGSIMGTVNRVLVTLGPGSIVLSLPQDIDITASPLFAALTLSNALSTSSGGTGIDSYTIGDLLCGASDGTLAIVQSNKLAARRYLTQTGTGGSSVAPVWNTINGSDVVGNIPGRALNVTGVVAVVNGGTNSGTALLSNRVMLSKSGAIVESAVLGPGQVIAGSSLSVPTVTSIVGTIKQVLVTITPGIITISIPQDIDTNSTPQFAGLFTASIEADSDGVVAIGSAPGTTDVQIACGSGDQVVTIGGGPGRTIINLGGGPNDIVNMIATFNAVAMENSYVQNKEFTLNKNGASGSGGGSAIYVEENGINTGFWRLSVDRTTIEMQAPLSVLMAFNQSMTTTSAVTLASLTLSTALAVASGGTGFASYNLGEILFGNNAGFLQKLNGNTTTSKRFLTQTGTGSGSAAPVWSALAVSDFNGLTLPVTIGGTGRVTYTTGDILLASAPTTISTLNASVGTGSVLLSSSSGLLPTFGKVGLTTHITGTLPVGNGGTGYSVYALGQLLYASGTAALARLNGNTSTSRMFLSQIGTGTVSTAPVWTIISLIGEVSGPINQTVLSNSAVIQQLLTNFTANVGTVDAADSIIGALQKIVGNLGTPTASNDANQIVKRNESGDFSANIITAITFIGTVMGNVSGSASTFTVALTGDVVGGANGTTTTVASVGGQTAAVIATVATKVTSASSVNTASQLMLRDAVGNTAVTNITLSSMIQGSVLYAGANGLVAQSNNNFFWDATNSRLGLGTNAPLATLDVNGDIRLRTAAASAFRQLIFDVGPSAFMRIGANTGDLFLQSGSGAPLHMGSYHGIVLTGGRATTTFPVIQTGSAATFNTCISNIPSDGNGMTNTIALIVQGGPSGNADLMRFQSGSGLTATSTAPGTGTVLARFNYLGALTLPNITLTSLLNQLVFNNVTVSVPTAVSARTYSIPDIGVSTADFLMSEGTQTINGTKTFTSPIVGSITGTASNVTGIVGVVNGGTARSIPMLYMEYKNTKAQAVPSDVEVTVDPGVQMFNIGSGLTFNSSVWTATRAMTLQISASVAFSTVGTPDVTYHVFVSKFTLLQGGIIPTPTTDMYGRSSGFSTNNADLVSLNAVSGIRLAAGESFAIRFVKDSTSTIYLHNMNGGLSSANTYQGRVVIAETL